jgi:hypothetical protein
MERKSICISGWLISGLVMLGVCAPIARTVIKHKRRSGNVSNQGCRKRDKGGQEITPAVMGRAVRDYWFFSMRLAIR